MTIGTKALLGLKAFHHWDVVALLVSMGVVLGFELLGVFTERYVTITYFVRTYLPRWWVVFPFWLWLGWHFLFGPQPIYK